MQRRQVLKAGGSAALYATLTSLGLLRPEISSAAWNEALFAAKNVPDTLKALGAAQAADSKDITIVASDIAENGAVVPVGITTKLANVEQIALLVEKNPAMVAGHYMLTAAAVPDVAMRVKMGQSSDVIALVKAGGQWYSARKEIKVTLGGCGG